MTWEKGSSAPERFSGLTDVCMECMEYLLIPNVSQNTMQSMPSLHWLERKLINCSDAMEVVLWQDMTVFMRSLMMAEY